MQAIKTVSGLFNGPLLDISVKLERTNILLDILAERYFTYTGEAVRNDTLKSYAYQYGYEEIQALIFTIRDYIWEANKTMDDTNRLDMKEIQGGATNKAQP